MSEPVESTGAGRGLVVEDSVRRFVERFGRPPRWVASAPGRVNLIGEHTDYNRGLVLPIAIDRWCVCVAAPAAEAESRFVVPDLDESLRLSLGEVARRGHAAAEQLPPWARYPVGAIVERSTSLDATRELPELDVLAVSTVPVGGGLSSSAAIETAAAVLVETALGIAAAPGGQADAFVLQRALDCQRAEHEWAGVPCGLMDQLASSFGRAGHALRIDCRDNTIEYVPMPSPERAVLLVVNSGVRHALASGEYAQRRAACEALVAELGVGSLRDLDIHALPRVEACSDENAARCGRHVVTEIERVRRAVAALRDDQLDTLGELMYESHASLRDDFRVSCPELDAIVELAGATPGVFGARMTGGGFGGCAVVLARPGAARELQHDLPGRYRSATGRECAVWTVRASDGAVGGPA